MKNLKFVVCICSVVLLTNPTFAQEFALAEGISEKAKEKRAEEADKLTEKREYDWEFWSSVKETFTEEDYREAGNSEFGREVACLMAMYSKQCVKKEQVIEGDPTMRTVIRKPVIYNAVKNIEKYYKRRMKENNVSIGDKQTLAHVVKVAISTIDGEDTVNFEKVLQQNKKNPEQQIETFQSVNLKNLY